LEKISYYQKLTGDDFWAPSAYLVKLVEEGNEIYVAGA
jgi:hypothetical protein